MLERDIVSNSFLPPTTMRTMSEKQENPMAKLESRVERVPASLQSIFIAANRGKVVSKPPPNQVASRRFRTWFAAPRTKVPTTATTTSTTTPAGDQVNCSEKDPSRASCRSSTTKSTPASPVRKAKSVSTSAQSCSSVSYLDSFLKNFDDYS